MCATRPGSLGLNELTHWCQTEMAIILQDIFKCIFMTEHFYILIEVSLIVVPQLTIESVSKCLKNILFAAYHLTTTVLSVNNETPSNSIQKDTELRWLNSDHFKRDTRHLYGTSDLACCLIFQLKSSIVWCWCRVATEEPRRGWNYQDCFTGFLHSLGSNCLPPELCKGDKERGLSLPSVPHFSASLLSYFPSEV